MAKRERKGRTEEMWMAHNRAAGFLPWAYAATSRRYAEERLQRGGDVKATILRVRITEIKPAKKGKTCRRSK